MRTIAAFIIALALMTVGLACAQSSYSSIGGTHVPMGLRCTEDEMIGFIGIDTLGCIHIESFKS